MLRGFCLIERRRVIGYENDLAAAIWQAIRRFLPENPSSSRK
jgi:hypothetical protein